MKNFTNLIAVSIVAIWIGVIAIFSIQNITDVSLKFLTFQTINIPVGVILAFSLGVGLISGSLLPILFSKPNRKTKPKLKQNFFRKSSQQKLEEDPLENW
ncbi:MAG: LapA family protein [Oscillatoria sp. PMC 1068.18]|nr:LapA family protein [Oscillatoria sp. PMC 1076.18]MEC4989883.1 LapA family protein [Oscillatoria sp. PMC 1068.18]